MHAHAVEEWEHEHVFGTDERRGAEGRTWWVIGLTAVMMTAEIAAGLVYGSMALLADGWHMGTHAAALGIAVFAYAYARRNAGNRRYSFGTGKVGALGGFASAVGLAAVAILVFGESVIRFASPVAIRFDEAIFVAVVGLVVNLVSAFILKDHDEHHHGHGHAHGSHEQDDHDHGHDHAHHDQDHHDHNLRGAYLHVMADAMTSVFAIVALLAGRQLGWVWMDPLMGIVGSRTLSTVNMPPISRFPNGPCPSSSAACSPARHVAHVGVVLVLGHAVFAHRHVARQQRADLLPPRRLVHAQRVRHVVAHRVHRVVRHVAVEGPVARGLATNSRSRVWPTPTISVTSVRHSARGPAPAVAAGDPERTRAGGSGARSSTGCRCGCARARRCAPPAARSPGRPCC
jgi:cation diffusion facilitator family transporter